MQPGCLLLLLLLLLLPPQPQLPLFSLHALLHCCMIIRRQQLLFLYITGSVTIKLC
jgi:hypothetical protein